MWTENRALDALTRANRSLRRGNYQDALHAYNLLMKPDPDAYEFFRGFQLSYVLSGWVRLAELYPEAGQALKALLVEKKTALTDSPDDRDLQYEIAAMEEAMKHL